MINDTFMITTLNAMILFILNMLKWKSQLLTQLILTTYSLPDEMFIYLYIQHDLQHDCVRKYINEISYILETYISIIKKL